MAEKESGWTSKWPANGFYWLRGWRHYADLPIKVDGDEFWMLFSLAAYHRTDLDDSADVEFLGPISPSDAEQLSELRKVLQTLRHHLWNQPDIVTLIDMALTPKQLEKKGRQQ